MGIFENLLRRRKVLIDHRLDGISPNLVSFRSRMKEVGHDFGAQGAVGQEELVSKVEKEDLLAIRVSGDNFINSLDPFAQRVGCIVSAREYTLHQDRGIGAELAVLVDDCPDPFGNLLVGVSSKIIGSDHQEDQLGVDSIHLPLGETPEQVFRPVGGYSEIKATQLFIAFLPDLATEGLPEVGDRIAVKDQLDLIGNLGGAVVGFLHACNPFQSGGRTCRRIHSGRYGW